MKQSLALLLAYVFFQVQIWAFAPVYPGNSQSLTGTYAGTLLGQVFFSAAGAVVAPPAGGALGANGAGVFVVGQPDAGLGSGVFAFFAQGTTYTGAVISITDPGNLSLDGIMKGEAVAVETVTVTGIGGGSVQVNVVLGFMGMSFNTDITFNQGRNSNSGPAGTRINGQGTATFQDVNLNPLGSSTILIDGFLQSNQVTSTVDLSALTNTTSSTGS